ncbi:hypothetical protein JXB02_02270 [Candidatus Woesearchaeota archaeon]|nr:hypothetical protein [Candidatus Woesearchaeota archaeon]
MGSGLKLQGSDLIVEPVWWRNIKRVAYGAGMLALGYLAGRGCSGCSAEAAAMPYRDGQHYEAPLGRQPTMPARKGSALEAILERTTDTYQR